MIAFGPVPSRRLGRSLGINNIPPKNCTYSCRYCQVGRTTNMSLERRPFYAPELVLKDVREHLARIGEPVDYLAFVPDGEPTLDAELGRTIAGLRALPLPIAVISNASLITRSDVRKDLARADWVSLKVDAVRKRTWRRMDRPSRKLDLDEILAGTLQFARSFSGQLVTETMLVEGLNDGEEDVKLLAEFLKRLKPEKAYLSIPTRPPAEQGICAPDEKAVIRAFQIVRNAFPRVEYLTGYEGNEFAASGNLEEDLLSITAVHPLKEKAVRRLARRNHAAWTQVEELVRRQQLAEIEYAGEKFYTRRWTSPQKAPSAPSKSN